ncbi:archease [Halogeometricum borinquense]|uniref:Archease n=1 Tax=Halogeometricum borinquense TaxID=60847 RepID=A0A6C0UHD4_9EURY|nr:archease [Halogeometricum borinquense]QIB74916.1 archease [Halogeometricum borinquense]QIQ76084.1 archease [Halogeometricum borinquense]
MSFELRDHTADVAVAASAPTRSALFAAVADGLAAAGCDEIPETGGDRFDVEVRAENVEALLFDYLDQLIFERDVRAVMPVDNEASVEERDGEWVLTGSARGVSLDEIDAREIKAVTYSEMRVEETDKGWEAYVVLDV